MNQWRLTSLPEVLHKYRDSDYLTQMRSRFVFYLLNVTVVTILLLIAFKIISYKAGIIGSDYNLKIIIPLVALLLIAILCRQLVIKGYLNFTSQAFPLIVTVIIWWIIFTDTNNPTIRLDTIVYIFALLTLMPVLAGHSRRIMLVYPIANAAIITVFLLLFSKSLGLNQAETIDLLIDISVSFMFIGIVNHNIYSINRKALAEIESDIRKLNDEEKALLKSDSRFRELTEQLPVMICEIDLKGNIKYINETGVKLFGYSREELYMVNLLSLLPERERVEKNMLRVIAGERKGNCYTAVKKNGEKITVKIFSSIVIENGMPAGIRGIIMDITEQMKSELELTASEKKYREMVSFLPQAIYESDLAGQITYLNKAGFDMFGYTSEDLALGLNVFQAVEEIDHPRVREGIAAILRGDLKMGGVYNGKRKDGSKFRFRLYSNVIMDDDNPVGIRGIIINVTDQF